MGVAFLLVLAVPWLQHFFALKLVGAVLPWTAVGIAVVASAAAGTDVALGDPPLAGRRARPAPERHVPQPSGCTVPGPARPRIGPEGARPKRRTGWSRAGPPPPGGGNCATGRAVSEGRPSPPTGSRRVAAGRPPGAAASNQRSRQLVVRDGSSRAPPPRSGAATGAPRRGRRDALQGRRVDHAVDRPAPVQFRPARHQLLVLDVRRGRGGAEQRPYRLRHRRARRPAVVTSRVRASR